MLGTLPFLVNPNYETSKKNNTFCVVAQAAATNSVVKGSILVYCILTNLKGSFTDYIKHKFVKLVVILTLKGSVPK